MNVLGRRLVWTEYVTMSRPPTVTSDRTQQESNIKLL